MIAALVLGLGLGWGARAQVGQVCVGVYPGMAVEIEDELLAAGLCTRMLTIVHITQYRRLLAGLPTAGVDPGPDL